MSHEPIEKAALEYAQNVYYPTPCGYWEDTDHIQMEECFSKAFQDGASFAISHQWVSVEERLPESEAEDVLTFTGCNMYGVEEYAVAHYDGKDWHTSAGEHIRPEYWMAIPLLSYKKEDK